MRQAFLEQSVRAPLTPPATVSTEKLVPNWPLSPETARRAPQLEATPPRIWPRLILGFVLVLIAVTGWAAYTRSQTGAFPPFVAAIESKIRPALATVAGKFGESSTQGPRPVTDDHGIAPAQTQNAETANAPAAGPQTSAMPAASSPAAVPTVQPVVAQSSSDHPIDHPINESAPVSGASASTPSVETPQKPDPFHRASSQAVESSDKNQPAADNATAHDSLTASSASRDNENDKQTTPPATQKPFARKRASESATVDGFSQRDIPDLLSQAYSSTARGDYRLARYEYVLVLKLDHTNVQAREGLRRLPAVWQSR